MNVWEAEMKKGTVFVFCFLMVFSATAFAQVGKDTVRKDLWPIQGYEGRIGIGTKIGFNAFQGSDINLYGTTVDIEANNSAMTGITATWLWHRLFSAEFAADFTVAGIEYDFDNDIDKKREVGDLYHIPLNLTFRFHMPTRFGTPYIGAGVGYYINFFDQDDSNVNKIYGQGADLDIESDFGWNVVAGYEGILKNHHSIYFEYKYRWAEVEASVDKPGFRDVDVDLDGYNFSVGYKYYF